MSEQRRVALVTGGTSGIGLEVTRRLASQGIRVYLCGRHKDVLESVLEELTSAGLDVDGSVCDVADSEETKSLVADRKSVV